MRLSGRRAARRGQAAGGTKTSDKVDRDGSANGNRTRISTLKGWSAAPIFNALEIQMHQKCIDIPPFV